MSDTGDLITRVYSNFRGCDFRGDEINLVRSPDCLNVWKDYKETESIRTRPEMERKVPFDDTVYGIFFYKDEMFVHSGTNLYKVVGGEKTVLFSGLNEAQSDSFVFENIWYFKDGKNYLQYDGATIKGVEGYVPTTSIGRKPEGGGTVYEDVNLLSGRRINTFLASNTGLYKIYHPTGVVATYLYNGISYNRYKYADKNGNTYWLYEHDGHINDSNHNRVDIDLNATETGPAYDYYLDAQSIDTDFKPIVRVDGVLVTDFTVDYEAGKITFTNLPGEPLTDGQDNVSVEFSKTVPGYRDRIAKCTLLQVFDNRVFFSGNPDYPNTVWHCSLSDPAYCSDLDYYKEGVDSAQIKGMAAGNNALWVFREPSDANTNVFYHTPTIDDEYEKIYPSSHSSIATGCVGKAINFNDDIIFFSDRGMEGISGDITTEQVIAHRSTLVDRKLIAEETYKDMILAEWEGYLLVFIGSKVYLADSRAVFTNENHIEYDWFYWDMGKEITSVRVYNGVLYLGTVDGVYTLTDNESAVVSYWVTPKDKFKYPHKLKTTNKRGCVAEATGDISVYAKVEDTDFELIGSHENVTDYFVSRIKRKKWKDIQLKFYSESRFSLETVTLEAFIGGYIKR